MGDLLNIRVAARDGVQLELRVRLLPTETGRFCTAREFVWMLVDPFECEYEFKALDPRALRECRAASSELDEANTEAAAYQPLARMLVLSVVVSEVRNYREERPYKVWADAANEEELYPEAVYRIRFADPRLCSHLPVGFEWKSSAYDEHGTNEFLPYE